MEKENRDASRDGQDTADLDYGRLEGPGHGECLLDVFTPQALIDRFGTHEDCTKEIVELVRTVQVQQGKMKKLCKVFCSVSNCSVDAIVELTRDRNRMLRYVSTYLVLTKVKQWIEDGRGFEVVETMYDEVFLVRFRDVDPRIRTICIEFMCEWVISVPKIFNTPCYLKYVGWSLSDKNDMVRKRGVESSIRIIERGVDVSTFIARFRNRIIELALYDRNQGVREEGRRLCMVSYLNGLMDKRDVYEVLRATREKDRRGLLGRVVSRILDGDLPGSSVCGLAGNHEGLHELFLNTSLFICSCIPHEDGDVTMFMRFIRDFLREKSSCCESRSLCYIRILRAFSGSIEDIGMCCEILEMVRDNRDNVVGMLLCIDGTGREVFSSRPDATNRLLGILRELAMLFRCEEVVGLFVQLLKKLETDFSPSVTTAIEYLRSLGTDFTGSMIKCFDVSGDVSEGHPVDVKCHGILWRIASGDYGYVNRCEFNEVGNIEVTCDFLLFFKEKCIEFGVVEERVEEAVDQGSSFKLVYERLQSVISRSAERLFVDGRSCISLFKLVEDNLLTDHSDLIFRRCSRDLVIELFSRSRAKTNLLSGYFRYLVDVDDDPSLDVVARAVASKCSSLKKVDKDRVVFKGMRTVVGSRRTFLYDKVLVYFVPILTVNECIIIEQETEKSRLKASLARRCRGRDTAGQTSADTTHTR